MVQDAHAKPLASSQTASWCLDVAVERGRKSLSCLIETCRKAFLMSASLPNRGCLTKQHAHHCPELEQLAAPPYTFI